MHRPRRRAARIVAQEITPWSSYERPWQVKAEIGRAAATIHHPCGICRTGLGADAVADADLRVRGVGNLRVIDASIMPNLTSMMIGDKGAVLLLRCRATTLL